MALQIQIVNGTEVAKRAGRGMGEPRQATLKLLHIAKKNPSVLLN